MTVGRQTKDREQHQPVPVFLCVIDVQKAALFDGNRLKVSHSTFAVLIAEHDELRALSAFDSLDLLAAIGQRDIYFAGLEELCAGQFRRIVVF